MEATGAVEIGLDEDVQAVGKLAHLDGGRGYQGMRIRRLPLKAAEESDGMNRDTYKEPAFLFFVPEERCASWSWGLELLRMDGAI